MPKAKLSYEQRLHRARINAVLRYDRRRTESVRLWRYSLKKWRNHPGVSWRLYERALHLEDQAYMLCNRLIINGGVQSPRAWG